MLKKLISYLVIFSIIVSDLAGWANRPAYGMINDPGEEGERGLFIPIKAQSPSEEISSPESQDNTNSQQSLADRDQKDSSIDNEQESREEKDQKSSLILNLNQGIPDLGHGIVSSDKEKERISLSPSQRLDLSLTLPSPQGESETKEPQEDMTLANVAHTLGNDILNEASAVPEQPSSPSKVFEKFEEKVKLSPRLEEIKELRRTKVVSKSAEMVDLSLRLWCSLQDPETFEDIRSKFASLF